VFDIADDLAELDESKVGQNEYWKKCTLSLAQKSDLVLVTACTLLDKFKKYSQNIHLIPNGYDSSLFSKERACLSPRCLSNIPSPIIGFVGTLFSYLDYNLIEYIIKRNNNKSFVFVGPCNNNVKKRWNQIIKNKNVFWLGRKKKEEIPAIVSKFNVCLNPFKVDSVSKSVSPLKVFEYLAMKKPVVSVYMESLKKEKVGKLIYFAKSYEEFNEKINVALRTRRSQSEYQSIKEYSWNSLFKKVNRLIDSTIM
jgi:glycosyltransferase involved in cell wall biosynthesis